MTTSNTNNSGIMHWSPDRRGGRPACNSRRAIMSTTTEAFRADVRQCKRCAARLAAADERAARKQVTPDEEAGKMETLRSPSTGLTRKVFKGQRWLVVSQHSETSPVDLLAFASETAADHMVGRLHNFGGLVQYIEEAELVA